MGKQVHVKKIDYTQGELKAETERTAKEIEESRERQRLAEQKRKEEEMKAQEKQRIETYKALHGKKKAKPVPYKPSRLIDVDSDLAIMNMEEVLNSVKETVEHIELVVGEIAEFLYRKDRKRADRFKMKQLKRKAKKK